MWRAVHSVFGDVSRVTQEDVASKLAFEYMAIVFQNKVESVRTADVHCFYTRTLEQ